MILNFGDGRLRVADTPICEKYYTTGVVNGFLSKEELNNILEDNSINADLECLKEKSEKVIIWDMERNNNSSNVHAFVDVDGRIVETKISIGHNQSKLNILEKDVSGISGLKLKNDTQQVLESSNVYIDELKRLDETPEGRIRSEITDKVGDIAILVENIDIVGGETFIPISIGDKDWKTPVVLARVGVTKEDIDISDVESKVCHLLSLEDAMSKIGKKVTARIRNLADVNYRKHKNNGDSFNKKSKADKELDSIVRPNRGRKPESQDEEAEHAK